MYYPGKLGLFGCPSLLDVERAKSVVGTIVNTSYLQTRNQRHPLQWKRPVTIHPNAGKTKVDS